MNRCANYCGFFACFLSLWISSLAAERDIVAEYQQLTSSYVQTLRSQVESLEKKSPADAQLVRDWLVPRISGRLVCYLPSDKSPLVIMEVRQKYAIDLFALIQVAAEQGRGELCYQWLQEVLHEDAEHAAARQILLNAKARPQAKKPLVKAITLEHAQFGWPRGRHWRIESEHFLIETNHSSKTALELAQSLETLHAVWQQLFPTVWTSSQKIVARCQSKDIPLAAPRQFRVVLFKDRTEYVRQLSKTKGIEVSTGIYLDEAKFSALFAGADAKRSTWFHEVTHQFFQEYWEAKPGVAGEENMWLVEAAALFMETFNEQNGYATVGGWDAENLQFARFRALGGDFYLPLDKLATLGRSELQQHADIRRLYSEMAGLGQFFLTAKQGAHRPAFVEALRLTYRNEAKIDSLSELLKQPYVELDRAYLSFLNVTNDDIAHSPPLPTLRQLSLRHTSITNAALAHFAACDQIAWLDLSLTEIGDAGLPSFPASSHLKQLFLERTKITSAAAAQIAKFRELSELYVSETNLSDEGLAELASLKKLKHLDLAGCPITDAGIEKLVQLSSLETLVITRTKITPMGIARLKKSFPRLMLTE